MDEKIEEVKKLVNYDYPRLFDRLEKAEKFSKIVVESYRSSNGNLDSVEADIILFLNSEGKTVFQDGENEQFLEEVLSIFEE